MKILLSGCTGAMGRVITEVCQSKRYEIVAGFAISDTGDLPISLYGYPRCPGRGGWL